MIRSISISALTLGLVIFLWACGTTSPNPKSVAKAYLVALKTNDRNTAEDLVTKDSQEAFRMYCDKHPKTGNPKDIVIKDVAYNSTQATIYYLDAGKEKILELRNVNGSWKVIYQKDPDDIGKEIQDFKDSVDE